MKYMKTIGYVLLAVLFVSTVPYAAEAANIKIQPHQLKPVDPGNPYNYQEPAHMKGDGGQASYYAVVSLPVGKTITQLTFHHRNDAAVGSVATLHRTKFGQIGEEMARQNTTQDTDDDIVPISTTDINLPKVKAGYTYHVRVTAGNGNFIHGVIVRYQ